MLSCLRSGLRFAKGLLDFLVILLNCSHNAARPSGFIKVAHTVTAREALEYRTHRVVCILDKFNCRMFFGGGCTANHHWQV